MCKPREDRITTARDHAPRSAAATNACLLLASLALVPACAEGVASKQTPDAAPHNEIASVPCMPDERAAPTTPHCSSDQNASSELPPCETWTKVQLDDATCSDGSPYKFFVNFAAQSDNLLIMFEPGGACWDFESCSGGARGAANPHGIPDDHMSQNQYLNLLRRTDDNPAKDWNLVFVSYCTGDIHVGDKVATYDDPSGGPALTYRHVGLANTHKVIDYLKDRFPSIPRLMVTGCSAGGVGSIQNYASIREELSGAQCGYLLDDSGPVFHTDGPSKAVQTTIHDAWNLDTYLSQAADSLIPPIGHDTQTILDQPWLGSDIPDQIDLHRFVQDLLVDSTPLRSYLQDPVSDADFTTAELAMCLSPD